ncbi:hypothetical protein, partial [Bifidobacterium adolescentis]|uniref:hypothetical protein n=1 Tax=Bifidobacterium adolescentis TaxID=1680 RepID=UPI001C01063D
LWCYQQHQKASQQTQTFFFHKKLPRQPTTFFFRAMVLDFSAATKVKSAAPCTGVVVSCLVTFKL